jgi:predicted PurR-regulated permease PerM
MDTQASGTHASPETTPRGRESRVISITPRTLWVAAAIVAGLVIVAFVVSKAQGVLIELFIAIVIAEGIRPLVERLRRAHVPRPVGVLLIYLVVLAILGVLSWLLLSPLIAEATALINSAPKYLAQAQKLLNDIQREARNNPQLTNLINQMIAQAGAVAQVILPGLVQVPQSILGLLFDAVLTLVMAFMWLTATDNFRPFVVGLFPNGTQTTASSVLSEIGHKIGGYLRGVTFNMLVVGVLSGLGVFLLGVPYPVLLGIFAGLTEFIPFIGPFIGGSAATLVALVTVGPLKAGEVILLYVVIQQIEGNTLVPLVMNRAVQLNPLVVVVAVLIGGAVLGLVGGILAVPLAVVIQVLVVRVLAPAARRASGRSAEAPEAPQKAELEGSQPSTS